MKIATIFTFVGSVSLVGCSSIPTAGPTTSQILDQAAQEAQSRFDFIDVDYPVLATQTARPAASVLPVPGLR
jgi:hypothetical protein